MHASVREQSVVRNECEGNESGAAEFLDFGCRLGLRGSQLRWR